VSRFVREKNLTGLVRAFARYRSTVGPVSAWDLVLCGDGPGARDVDAAIELASIGHAVHRPGFLQADALVQWYAYASAFVHPSLMEPWGLVVNEAAACGLPLLVSRRAGCSETLVPDPPGTTGWRFDPADEAGLAALLAHVAMLPESSRAAIGQRAAELASAWGPERFARGTLEALEIAQQVQRDGTGSRTRHLTLAQQGGIQ
jgi:1,2-diacylglycerol 3-alpha-glucosyltransferase